MIPNRLKRINCEIQSGISRIILREMKDPRIGFVTITDVETAPDLRHAKVFISVMESEERQQETLAGLTSAAHFLRQCLRESIATRHIPELSFHLDNSIERGVRISHLIDEARKKDKEIQ
jgi:ribosome-binding factor A